MLIDFDEEEIQGMKLTTHNRIMVQVGKERTVHNRIAEKLEAALPEIIEDKEEMYK